MMRRIELPANSEFNRLLGEIMRCIHTQAKAPSAA
jgi:hypothetical protein